MVKVIKWIFVTAFLLFFTVFLDAILWEAPRMSFEYRARHFDSDCKTLQPGTSKFQAEDLMKRISTTEDLSEDGVDFSWGWEGTCSLKVDQETDKILSATYEKGPEGVE
jgi:hypothetical protein